MSSGLKIFKSQKGTVAVLMAIAMVFLAGFTALVTDAGLIFMNQGRLENSLDSAVLAGAQELPADPQRALDTARQYAELNGMQEGEADFAVSSDYRSISGNAERRVGMLFARVLGVDRANVRAAARAHVSPIASVNGVAPFGVLDYDYNFGDVVVLKEGAGENFYAGWFGALSLGGTGASVYLDNVRHGYGGQVKIGDVIQIEAGNMSGPTKQGIEDRISQCHHTPYCSIFNYEDGCPRILIIPIIDIEEIDYGGHVFSVRVVGFGAFLVDQYVGNGNENEIQGSFISYVIPGSGNDSAEDFGLYEAKLSE
ncbi:MAG: TadE/TadG family type IV pilus assembly protein [Deltaproteobacteria bacterium]